MDEIKKRRKRAPQRWSRSRQRRRSRPPPSSFLRSSPFFVLFQRCLLFGPNSPNTAAASPREPPPPPPPSAATVRAPKSPPAPAVPSAVSSLSSSSAGASRRRLGVVRLRHVRWPGGGVVDRRGPLLCRPDRADVRVGWGGLLRGGVICGGVPVAAACPLWPSGSRRLHLPYCCGGCSIKG